MSRKEKPGNRTVTTGVVSLLGLLLAFVLYIAVNTLFTVWTTNWRLDVSEGRLYTLSQGTHQTLSQIDEPVVLHFFFSQRLGREIPVYASYARRVRELLSEIVATSNGKVILYEHNPESFSSAEDLAVSHGVQGIPVDEGGELAYFGLSGINTIDEIELIPFFQTERENLLEYDLLQMINTLSNAEPVTIGIMGSLPLMGSNGAGSTATQATAAMPWAIAKQLKTHFNIMHLPESIDALPRNIDVMMVVHPQTLNQRAIYELEQFLFRGGRALFFIDPKAESDLSVGPKGHSDSTRAIQLLLNQWGIDVPQGQLLADQSMALRINAGSAERPVPAEYLVWLKASVSNMDQDDPVTSQLTALNLASSGFIQHDKDSLLKMQPLVFSGVNSSPIAVEKVSGLRPDILGLLKQFRPDSEQYVMAARFTGDATSAFSEGPPERVIPKTEQELAEKPELAQLMTSAKPMNIILVADSDLLEDRFWLRKQQFFGREVEQPIAGNADFVINALGNLAGSDELLRLRSRGVSHRPFEKVKQLQQQSASRLQVKERDLQDKLKQVQSKVAEFENSGSNQVDFSKQYKSSLALTTEQRQELEALRAEMLSIRQQLRSVQRELREDVERLERRLQFFNIGLVPIIISVVALFLGFLRIARRRQYSRAHRRVVV
ncbi:MAG: Gldg family protein [Arenicella sp.]